VTFRPLDGRYTFTCRRFGSIALPGTFLKGCFLALFPQRRVNFAVLRVPRDLLGYVLVLPEGVAFLIKLRFRRSSLDFSLAAISETAWLPWAPWSSYPI